MESTINKKIDKLEELERMFNFVNIIYEQLKLKDKGKYLEAEMPMHINIDFSSGIFGFGFANYLRRYLADEINIAKTNLKYELEHDLKLDTDEEVIPNE